MSTTAISLLRAQYTQSGEWLEGTMQGVTDEVAHFVPPGPQVAPIAGQIAHAIVGLDFFIINMVGGKTPLMMSSFADKSGISEPPPQSGDWLEWGRRVRVDGPAMHEYATAVFAAIDEVLASLDDSDLDREVELGPAGNQTIGWAFNVMILNTYSHTGEIACIKGLQGLKGYPM